MATSPPSPTRHGRRRLVISEDHGEEEETRDWAGMPQDALVAVLVRLDLADVLLGAGHVCRPWRRAARQEPLLWRRIDIRRCSKLGQAYHFQPAVCLAVRRRARWCEDFWADGTAGDQYFFFAFLADASPQLKSLRLSPCNAISKQGLNGAISKLSMLEELELSLTSGDTALSGSGSLAETCTVAAGACQHLKHLMLNKYRFHWQSGIGDGEAMEVAKMSGLRSLQLFGNSLCNAGLTAILDGCVSLESLDLRHCFNVEMDDEMRGKCARLQTLRLPEASMDDYELSFGCPEMEPGSPDVNIGSPQTPGDPDNIGSSWYFR